MKEKSPKKVMPICLGVIIICLSATILSANIYTVHATSGEVNPADLLQDNTLVGPVYNIQDWNCYAFALGYEYRWIGVGNFSGNYFNRGDSVDITAEKVKEDLLSLEFDNVEIYNEYPNVCKGEELICVCVNGVDYHFMKYYKGDWYHKFPETAIMMYNYEPSNDKDWIVEGVCENFYYPENGRYTSEIRYIKYTPTYLTEVNNGEATIVGRDFTPSGDIYIPEEIDGYPVTAIADSFFKGCYKILSVELPQGLKSIGSSAFEGCTRLSKVEIANDTNVIRIGDSAFKNTSADIKLIVPENMYSAYTSSYGNIFGDNIYASANELTAYKTAVYEISPEIRIETNYAVDGDFGEGNEEGFFYEGIGYVGYYLTMYYAHCLTDYYMSDIEKCELIINFGMGADGEICYLFDSDRRQKGVSEVSGGIAQFDFTDIINSDGEFYIVPKEDNTRIIEFSPSGVSLRASVCKYIQK